MPERTRRYTHLSRRAAIALVVTTLLPRPAGVRADHDGT